MGVRPSMGTVGDAYENAMAESFFATLECELIDRRVWRTHAQARHAIFTWVESWYNPERRQSSLGQISPMGFGRRHALATEQISVTASAEAASEIKAQRSALPTVCFAAVDKPGG